MSQAAVSDWETGKVYPSWRRQHDLSRALGFNLLELVAARSSADPVEQAILSQPGLTAQAQQALVDVYRAMLEATVHDGGSTGPNCIARANLRVRGRLAQGWVLAAAACWPSASPARCSRRPQAG